MPIQTNLANSELRETAFRQFLAETLPNSPIVEMRNMEDFYALWTDSSKNADILAAALQHLFDIPARKDLRLDAADLVFQMMQGASAENPHDQHSCLTLWPTFASQLQCNMQTGVLHLTFPSAAIAGLFKTLDYKYLSIQENELRCDLAGFLREYPESLFLISLGSEMPPMVWLNIKAMKDTVYLMEKEISETDVEITPFMLALKSTTPPVYHFVLDTSGSMNEAMRDHEQSRLQALQESVLKFSQVLFDFQPQAELSITTFNTSANWLGTYTQNSQVQLRTDVNQLSGDKNTHLYSTITQKIEEIVNNRQQNNILLFTDGGDTEGSPASKTALKTRLETLGAIHGARNKFYIVRFADQRLACSDRLIPLVTKTFDSALIESSDPDLQRALEQNGRLKQFAAARELFSCRYVVTDSIGAEETSYSIAIEQSSQFVKLSPLVAPKGSRVNLRICDTQGEIFSFEKEIARPAVQVPESRLAESAEVSFFPPAPKEESSFFDLGAFLKFWR